MNSYANPLDIIQSTPFDETKEPNLRKLKIGDLSFDAHLNGVHEGIMGMQKNEKRLIVAPISNTNEYLWMEVAVLRLKTAPVEQHEELVNRMRKLSRAGSGTRSGLLAHVSPSENLESIQQQPSVQYQQPPSPQYTRPSTQQQYTSPSTQQQYTSPSTQQQYTPPSTQQYAPHSSTQQYSQTSTQQYQYTPNQPEAIVPFEPNYSISHELLQEKARLQLQQQQNELAAKKKELGRYSQHTSSYPRYSATTTVPGSTKSYTDTSLTVPGLTSSTYHTDLLQRVKSSTQSIEDSISDMNGKYFWESRWHT